MAEPSRQTVRRATEQTLMDLLRRREMPGWATEAELTRELQRYFQAGGDVPLALQRLRQEGHVERRRQNGRYEWRYRTFNF